MSQVGGGSPRREGVTPGTVLRTTGIGESFSKSGAPDADDSERHAIIGVMQHVVPKLSLRRLCALAGVRRPWYYPRSQVQASEEVTALRDTIEHLTLECPSYGYSHSTVALRLSPLRRPRRHARENESPSNHQPGYVSPVRYIAILRDGSLLVHQRYAFSDCTRRKDHCPNSSLYNPNTFSRTLRRKYT
jgi:hypothetical protein